jgi:DNA invertase Pin-like site-specific DNA recombinase
LLKEAIALAKKHKAVLLVAKLDRLSRKVSYISKIMEDTKLELMVACMPSADKFQLHIYAALAEKERDFISQRTKAALAEAKARGQKLGGLRDKTMKRNKVLIAQANERAAKLEPIVTPMMERGDSLRVIASALNDAGITTVRGGTWKASQVKRLLERVSK